MNTYHLFTSEMNGTIRIRSHVSETKRSLQVSGMESSPTFDVVFEDQSFDKVEKTDIIEITNGAGEVLWKPKH
jgi:hypothetical protein